MASRKEEKEQRRREREELERRERAQERRRRARTLVAAAVAVVVVGGVATLLLLNESKTDASEVFAAKPEGLQERVKEAGLKLGSDHFHPTVRVVVEGKPVPIPVDIGTDRAGGHVPLHRHTGDDQLHAEGVEKGTLTLGQFMKVWGVPLTPARLGPYEENGRHKVTVLAKSKGEKRFREVTDVNATKLGDGDEVYVVYGTPAQSPIEQ